VAAPPPPLPYAQPATYQQPYPSYPQNAGYQQQQTQPLLQPQPVFVNPSVPEDSRGNFAIGFIISFFFSLLGFILCILLFQKSPQGRKGAVIGLIVGIVTWTLVVVLTRIR